MEIESCVLHINNKDETIYYVKLFHQSFKHLSLESCFENGLMTSARFDRNEHFHGIFSRKPKPNTRSVKLLRHFQRVHPFHALVHGLFWTHFSIAAFMPANLVHVSYLEPVVTSLLGRPPGHVVFRIIR